MIRAGSPALLLVLMLVSLLAPVRTALAEGYLVAAASNHGLDSEPVLRFAERDALAVRDVLQRFGTHEKLRVRMLLGKDARELEEVIAKLALQPDDSLYIYFSGHADRHGLHLGTKVFAFDRLRSMVELARARVKLLIVDACGSGKITRSKGARPAVPFSIAMEDRLRVSGTAIVTSSADSEDSQESDELGGSFFTYHFLQGLRGTADRDRDNAVTLNEAFGYARRQTLRSTALTHQLQHPRFEGQLFGPDSELVLSRLEKSNATAVVSLTGPGLYLVFDDRDALFAEIYVENVAARYFLPAGRWLIQKRQVDNVAEHRIDLGGGEERTLSKHDATLVPLTRLEAKGRADHGLNHRIQVLGGAYGAIVAGHPPLPTLWLGYRHRFSGDLELAAETRLARNADVEDVLGVRTHLDYGAAFGVARAGAGLAIEATLHRQRTPHLAQQLYAGVGLVTFVDVKLSGPIALRLEGGPAIHVIKLEDGERNRYIAPIAWWIAGGPTWGF